MPGGEIAVKTGAHGEKMMEEFLKLIGWEGISQNETFQCSLGKKHKDSSSKSERGEHNVDATFHYENPLNHSDADVILCSSKHNQDKYADKNKAVGFLRDLAHSLECADKDFNFAQGFESGRVRKNFKGLLFWVSSNPDEQDTSMITQISESLIRDDEDEFFSPRLRGIGFDSIYVVDNRRLTFILSAIKTAQFLHPLAKVRYLFPHTGYNNESELLVTYGDILPIQYINTSLLPIVIDEGDKITLLIFCDSKFDSQYLKRLIWFAHKVSGLASDVIIFFNDYDRTLHESDANKIKRLFQNSGLVSRISLKKISVHSLINLKDDQPRRELLKGSPVSKISKQITYQPDDQDLDRILPFGEMIKPIIASTILSDTDIKSFLIRKGIYIGNKEKQNTVPLLSTLLLSPEELEVLKYLLKTKEDRVKSVPRSCGLTNVPIEIDSLRNLVGTSISESLNRLSLPNNCQFHKRPSISLADNQVKVDFIVEKRNSTKDLITGKQHHEGSVTFSLTSGTLEGEINYTSPEIYKIGNKLFGSIEKVLLDQKVIASTFQSIRFDSFTNLERVNFFMRFLSTKGESVFKDAVLEHIVVKPDESLDVTLPFDLESLKSYVKHLAISGSALDSVHYFQEDYKVALLMQRVKIKYDYNLSGEKGKCIVDLDFKNALGGNHDAEIHLNLEIQKSRSTKGRDLDKLKRGLRSSFSEMMQRKFNAAVGQTT